MSKVKKCKECLAEIPKAATKCQHCGSKQRIGVGILKGTLIVLLVLIFLPLIISSIVGSSGSSNSPTVSQSNENQRLQLLVQKNRKIRRQKTLNEYSENPDAVITKLKTLINSGKANVAMREVTKYKSAGVKDARLIKVTLDAKVAMDVQEEQRLLAEVKSVPAKDIERNKTLYAKLAKLNPSKKTYQSKRDYYQKKINTEKAEAAARKIIFGEMPVQSGWDGSYSPVERYLKKVANDPDSIDMDGCTKVFIGKSGWLVGCKFRGKNSFGATILNAKWFTIVHDQVVNVEPANRYKWN